MRGNGKESGEWERGKGWWWWWWWELREYNTEHYDDYCIIDDAFPKEDRVKFREVRFFYQGDCWDSVIGTEQTRKD